MRKAFDGFLILAIVVGGSLAWRSGRERTRLSEKHARLVRITGDLPVSDPSKVYVQVLDTGEPLHFAWRVYCPPNYQQVWSSRSGGGQSTSWSSGPSEFIARVRFREDESGVTNVYTHFGGSSGKMGFGDKALAEFLRHRWDKIRVQQLGATGLTAVRPHKSALVLRLTLPDELKDEARKTLSPSDQEQFLTVLFELDLGPDPAMAPPAIPKP